MQNNLGVENLSSKTCLTSSLTFVGSSHHVPFSSTPFSLFDTLFHLILDWKYFELVSPCSNHFILAFSFSIALSLCKSSFNSLRSSKRLTLSFSSKLLSSSMISRAPSSRRRFCFFFFFFRWIQRPLCSMIWGQILTSLVSPLGLSLGYRCLHKSPRIVWPPS